MTGKQTARLTAWAVSLATVQWTFAAEPDALLDRLQETDYVTRRDATEKLLQDRRMDMDRLGQLWQRASDLEQRQRLLQVTRHHLIRRSVQQAFGDDGPGFIGIRLEPAADDSDAAVRVAWTFPGFPGYAHLRPGDLIVALNDVALNDAGQDNGAGSTFDRRIRSLRAGALIRLTVRRAGQVVDICFALGNHAAFDQVYRPQALAHHPHALHGALGQSWLDARRKLEARDTTAPPLAITLESIRLEPEGPARPRRREDERGGEDSPELRGGRWGTKQFRGDGGSSKDAAVHGQVRRHRAKLGSN